MTEVWTEDRIEKLRRLYNENYSFSKIAAAIGGGLSRNACIGKAHRLGITGHKVGRKPAMGPTAIRAPKKPPTQGISAAVQKINMAKAAPPKVKPEPFVMQCAEVVPLGISLMDLTDSTCRWPDGDSVVTFCGHHAPDGPYCSAHRKIAFAPRHGRGGVHPAEIGKSRGGIFRRTA